MHTCGLGVTCPQQITQALDCRKTTPYCLNCRDGVEMVLEVVKVFAALLITLAAVYLLLRFLKQKMLPHKGMIEMLYYQSFGPKKGIAVVKVLNDYMAVGIGDQGISLLSKLNREGVEEALKSQPTENIVQRTKHKWLQREGNRQ